MAESGDDHLNGAVSDEEDPELSNLLDSALDELDKQNIPIIKSSKGPSATKTTKPESESSNTASASGGAGGPSQTQQGLNFEDFSQVDDVLKKFMDEDPILKQHWEQMASQCARESSPEDFEASLTATLKNLSEKAKSLADGGDESMSEEELSKMWSKMGLGEGADPGSLPGANLLPDIMPLVTNMMQNLLSKDILYPALTDLSNKYPGWLDENKDSLSEEQLSKYVRQLDLMRLVVSEFDSESSNDTESVKSERFQRILQTMQKMQELGSPPKDLVGDVPDLGMPDFAEMASKIPGFNPGTGAGPPCVIQ